MDVNAFFEAVFVAEKYKVNIYRYKIIKKDWISVPFISELICSTLEGGVTKTRVMAENNLGDKNTGWEQSLQGFSYRFNNFLVVLIVIWICTFPVYELYIIGLVNNEWTAALSRFDIRGTFTLQIKTWYGYFITFLIYRFLKTYISFTK